MAAWLLTEASCRADTPRSCHTAIQPRPDAALVRVPAELRQRHPELWVGFAQAVRTRPSLSAYWDAVGAVDALPLAPPPLPPLPPELSSVASLPLSVRGPALSRSPNTQGLIFPAGQLASPQQDVELSSAASPPPGAGRCSGTLHTLYENNLSLAWAA